MFDRHETQQSIVNIPAYNPNHLVKVTDKEGQVTVIQAAIIRYVNTYDGGVIVHLIDKGYFRLNLSAEDLFAQMQSQLKAGD